MADGERITYLDLRSLFLNPDGSPNHEVMSTDDVHLAGPGYEAWGAAIVPVLRRLAGG
jgi:lysophospholipase L1-like esterase